MGPARVPHHAYALWRLPAWCPHRVHHTRGCVALVGLTPSVGGSELIASERPRLPVAAWCPQGCINMHTLFGVLGVLPQVLGLLRSISSHVCLLARHFCPLIDASLLSPVWDVLSTFHRRADGGGRRSRTRRSRGRTNRPAAAGPPLHGAICLLGHSSVPFRGIKGYVCFMRVLAIGPLGNCGVDKNATIAPTIAPTITRFT